MKRMKSGIDYELTVLWRSILGKYNASENESAAWSFVDITLSHPDWVQFEDRQKSMNVLRDVSLLRQLGCIKIWIQ